MCWVVAVIGLTASAASAQAGSSAFAWAYDTDTLRTRKTEIQFWVSEENGDVKETEFWAMPAHGLTRRLELALPTVLSYEVGDGEPARFTFERHGIEARYRFSDDALVPLGRIAVFREVDARGVTFEGDVVVSYTRGRIHAVFDFNYAARFLRGADEFEIYPRAGVSVLVAERVRLGVESYIEYEMEHGYEPEELEAFVIGPNISFTRRRFWLSATYGIGIGAEIRNAPRVQFGMTL